MPNDAEFLHELITDERPSIAFSPEFNAFVREEYNRQIRRTRLAYINEVLGETNANI
jgi:hypothetical protein